MADKCKSDLTVDLALAIKNKLISMSIASLKLLIITNMQQINTIGWYKSEK